MRRRLVLLMMSLSLGGGMAYAQRYLPGMGGVQVTGGVVDGLGGFSASLAYSRYDRHSNHWMFGGGLVNRKMDDLTGKLPVVQFLATGGYYIHVLSDRRKMFFLSLGINALGGYETVNGGRRTLPDGGRIMDRDRLVYGGGLTLELESYLTDRLVFLVEFGERCLLGGDTGRFGNGIGIGVKYIID